MKTTLGEILSYKPCGRRVGSGFGWDLLTKTLGTKDPNTEVDLIDILKSNGIEDAVWALRTQEYLDYCLFSADVADLALPVFEAYSPDDSRVKDCIQAVRDFKSGKITSDRLKAAAMAAAESAMAAAEFAKAVEAAEAAWSAVAAATKSTWAAGPTVSAAVGSAGAAGENWSTTWTVAAWTAPWFDIEDLFVEHFRGAS